MLPSILFSALAIALKIGGVDAKAIFAHYMVGTITEEHAQSDISDAFAIGIDAFALNIGNPMQDYAGNGDPSNDANFILRALQLQGIKALGKKVADIERIQALECIAAIPDSVTKMIQYLPTDAEFEMWRKATEANEAERRWKKERRRIRTPEEQQLIRDARLQRRIHATSEELTSLEREDELRRRRGGKRDMASTP